MEDVVIAPGYHAAKEQRAVELIAKLGRVERSAELVFLRSLNRKPI